MTHRICLALFGLLALPGLAGASPVYSESFDAPGFRGGFISTAPGERSMATTYDFANSFDGWVFSGAAFAAVVDGNTAILLNEWPVGASAATRVTGLVPNARYQLSFTLTGDDRMNALSDLLVSIDGTQRIDVTHVWSTNGPGVLVTTDFTAQSNTAQLLFAQRDLGNAASPAIDSVQISQVPEPGSLAILGTALLGLMLMHRRRARVAAVQ